MNPTHRRILTIATVVTFVTWAGLILVGLPTDRGAVILSNVGQCTAPALAALGCLLASRRAITDRQALGWKLLAASAMSWSLGQVAWTYYEVSGAAAPFPSLQMFVILSPSTVPPPSRTIRQCS